MLPDYQTLMLPVLKKASNDEVSTRDVIEKLAQDFGLTEEERTQLLPSGRQRTFDNRVHWAKSYLKQAGLVHYTKRGYYIATDAGLELLAQKPEQINNNLLNQYEAFQNFRSRQGTRSNNNDTAQQAVDQSDTTPDETLRRAHEQINDALASELLERVVQSSPEFFEQLIVNLLIEMGYGGTSEDTAQALRQSRDNGVDGVVNQDPLGVDQIYVQAKRYAPGNNVGSSEIRDFFGALNLKKAKKGIFFTTSDYSHDAKKNAKDFDIRIVLINGDELAKLMIRYNVGCRPEETLSIKRVDEDFFEQVS